MKGMEEPFLPAQQLRELTAKGETLPEIESFVMFWLAKTPKQRVAWIAPISLQEAGVDSHPRPSLLGERVVNPETAPKELLKLLHDAHQGTTAMKRVATALFWWPGLDGQVEQITRISDGCTQGVPMPPPRTTVSWPETGDN